MNNKILIQFNNNYTQSHKKGVELMPNAIEGYHTLLTYRQKSTPIYWRINAMHP